MHDRMLRAMGQAAILFLAVSQTAWTADMKVGAGRTVITPDGPIWMAGYAGRKAPSEGKIHDLYAKALVFENPDGLRSVVVTTDLLGIPANVARRCVELAKEKFGIPRERLMLTSSHTHCGPVVRTMLIDMYALDEANGAKVSAYTDALPELLMQAIASAVGDLQPCSLEWGVGTAGFAKNRRAYSLGGVDNAFNPIGPVDHDVPVLIVKRKDASLKATLFGYACHNTTLSFQQLCGDYAGFAQAAIESKMPNVTALFVSGCGADQNPLPRGSIEQAQQYGQELGDAVLAVVNGQTSPVNGPLLCAFEEIPLKLSAPPSREDIQKQIESGDIYVQRRAKKLMQTLDEKGALETSYPYPVQVWQFSDTLQLSALAGEVVVDYSLLLKYEYGRDKQFVIAYANDVMAYIPSLRVLREGGYEGETAMIYYGLYGPWAPTVEQDVLASVRRLTESLKKQAAVK
jgi:neutral ceramidase